MLILTFITHFLLLHVLFTDAQNTLNNNGLAVFFCLLYCFCAYSFANACDGIENLHIIV